MAPISAINSLRKIQTKGEYFKRNSLHIVPFFRNFMTQAFFGLILGVAIDYSFELIKKRILNEEKKETLSVVMLTSLIFSQLLASFFILFLFANALPEGFHTYWQTTSAGLVFPALYYGTQSVLFENLKSIYKKL